MRVAGRNALADALAVAEGQHVHRLLQARERRRRGQVELRRPRLHKGRHRLPEPRHHGRHQDSGRLHALALLDEPLPLGPRVRHLGLDVERARRARMAARGRSLLCRRAQVGARERIGQGARVVHGPVHAHGGVAWFLRARRRLALEEVLAGLLELVEQLLLVGAVQAGGRLVVELRRDAQGLRVDELERLLGGEGAVAGRDRFRLAEQRRRAERRGVRRLLDHRALEDRRELVDGAALEGLRREPAEAHRPAQAAAMHRRAAAERVGELDFAEDGRFERRPALFVHRPCPHDGALLGGVAGFALLERERLVRLRRIAVDLGLAHDVAPLGRADGRALALPLVVDRSAAVVGRRLELQHRVDALLRGDHAGLLALVLRLEQLVAAGQVPRGDLVVGLRGRAQIAHERLPFGFVALAERNEVGVLGAAKAAEDRQVALVHADVVGPVDVAARREDRPATRQVADERAKGAVARAAAPAHRAQHAHAVVVRDPAAVGRFERLQLADAALLDPRGPRVFEVDLVDAAVAEDGVRGRVDALGREQVRIEPALGRHRQREPPALLDADQVLEPGLLKDGALRNVRAPLGRVAQQRPGRAADLVGARTRFDAAHAARHRLADGVSGRLAEPVLEVRGHPRIALPVLVCHAHEREHAVDRLGLVLVAEELLELRSPIGLGGLAGPARIRRLENVRQHDHVDVVARAPVHRLLDHLDVVPDEADLGGVRDEKVGRGEKVLLALLHPL